MAEVLLVYAPCLLVFVQRATTRPAADGMPEVRILIGTVPQVTGSHDQML